MDKPYQGIDQSVSCGDKLLNKQTLMIAYFFPNHYTY